MGAFIITGGGAAGGAAEGEDGRAGGTGIASPNFLPQLVQNVFPGSIFCPQETHNTGGALGTAVGIAGGAAAGADFGGCDSHWAHRFIPACTGRPHETQYAVGGVAA
jgi:hypothetical protein